MSTRSWRTSSSGAGPVLSVAVNATKVGRGRQRLGLIEFRLGGRLGSGAAARAAIRSTRPLTRWRRHERRDHSQGRSLELALLCAAAASLIVQPADAITRGVVDTVHTNVGVIRFTTETGRFRCSGTLISPTVVLTAGHCTGEGTGHERVRLVQHRPARRPARCRHHAGRERSARSQLHHRHGAPGPRLDRHPVDLEAARPGRRGARRPGDLQVARHHARPVAAGRHARHQPGRAEERDVHPGRLRRRHRRQEGTGRRSSGAPPRRT